MAPNSYKNTAGHPLALDDGRMVGTGESVTIDYPGEGDKTNIEAGFLTAQSGSDDPFAGIGNDTDVPEVAESKSKSDTTPKGKGGN
jgi:hypothetical protein